jgi:Tol biopolymer transport system component
MLAYAIALEQPALELTILDSTLNKRVVEVDLTREGFAEPGETTLWGILDMRWINDRWMIADLYDREDPSGHTIRVAMIDSADGTAIALPPDRAPELSPLSSVIISPDMDRALYVSDNDTLVLVEIDTGEVLWRDEEGISVSMVRSAFAWTNLAAWAPDGSMVAYSAHEEPSWHLFHPNQFGLFILDREGEVNHRITAFSDMGFERFFTSALTWSPDGRKLAFVAHYLQDQEGHYPPYLMISDVEEKQLRCVSKIIDDEVPRFARIVWSPDGQFISYVTWVIGSSGERRWFIVDVNSGTTYEVDSEIFQVAGWSSEFAP